MKYIEIVIVVQNWFFWVIGLEVVGMIFGFKERSEV